MKYKYLCRRDFFTILLLLTPCFFATLHAQNIDSVLGLLKEQKQENKAKMQLYLATAVAYRFSNPDSVMYYANKGLALANQLHYDKGAAECLVTKTLACLITGRLDSGIKYSEDALKIYGKTKDSVAMGQAFFYIAAAYYNQAKFEKAIEYYLLTIRADKTKDNYNRTGDSYDNIGVAYSTMGKYSESLKYYFDGLKMREKAKDKDGASASLGNIGRVYASLGNHTKAIEYVNKSLAMQDGSNSELSMINYENAGNVYLSINDTTKALMAFETAIRIADSTKQATEINRIMANTAEVLITMKKYDEALDLYNRCLANNAIPNSPAVDAMIHRGLGRIYFYKKDYKKAIKEEELAISMFRENEMTDHLSETLKDLSYVYAAVNDYQNAYKIMMQYNKYRDSVLNKETDDKVKELQYEYDLQKKQSQIELLAKDSAIAEGRAEKQSAILLGLASVTALLAVIMVLMYRSHQREKAAKELISQQAERLGDLNNYKDKIFSVLAHDLRGPIGSLASSMTMLDVNAITPKEFSELKPLIHQQISSVTLLLDNLLKWSMNYITEGKALKKEPMNLQKLVAQNVKLMQNNIDQKNISIHNNIPADTTATGDPSSIDIVIRNLISNAIKFTNENGAITISTKATGNKTELSVSDNGIGMTEAQRQKLFTATTDNSTSGTKGERGIGLGLVMSHEFAKANNGDIVVESQVGKGSTFTLILPV